MKKYLALTVILICLRTTLKDIQVFVNKGISVDTFNSLVYNETIITRQYTGNKGENIWPV